MNVIKKSILVFGFLIRICFAEPIIAEPTSAAESYQKVNVVQK